MGEKCKFNLIEHSRYFDIQQLYHKLYTAQSKIKDL